MRFFFLLWLRFTLKNCHHYIMLNENKLNVLSVYRSKTKKDRRYNSVFPTSVYTKNDWDKYTRPKWVNGSESSLTRIAPVPHINSPDIE